MLNIFQKDAFNSLSMTNAANRLPYKPSRLGAMGLFEKGGVTTTMIGMEWKEGKISLLTTAARGSMPNTSSLPNRKVIAFNIPYIPKNDVVMADEVQNVRAFGSEDQLEAVADVINGKMAAMRQDFEVTHEYHRVGAIQGVVKDGDGSTTLLNLFTIFGVTEVVVTFDFTPGAQDMKLKCLEVIRAMEDALGADTYDHIHAFCSNTFFDAFITHADVKESFATFQDNVFSREIEPQRRGFDFCDIVWENYRGKVGATDFIPTATCRFVPVGTRGIFLERYAPAPFNETVNTVGKPVYAKQEVMKFDVGTELHMNSNPLIMCARPSVLIKGLKSP